MTSTDNLARRIASAQERLNAARRDGRFDDIVTWRQRRDELLDEWPRSTPQPKEIACPSPSTSPSS